MQLPHRWPARLAAWALVAAAMAPAPCRATTDTTQVQALAGRIEGFSFDTCMRMGVGGMLAVSTCPVVLFSNGELLRSVDALRAPDQLAAHRAARPDQWTRWRRAGGEIQIQRKDGWRALPYQVVHGSLPQGFRLDGLYRSLGGAGTAGVGGRDVVAAWRDYRFFADGRVVRDGGAGGRSEFAGTSVATQSRAAALAGRYRIDGLRLEITYDNGSTEQRIVITDPRDPRGAIWLDGTGYVRR